MVSMIFSSFSMVTEFNCLAVEFEGLCPSPAIGPYASSLKNQIFMPKCTYYVSNSSNGRERELIPNSHFSVAKNYRLTLPNLTCYN